MPSTARAARPPQPPASHFGGISDFRKYSAQDIRYTTKGEILYAFVMGWPKDGNVTLKSLASGSQTFPRRVAKIELLGSNAPITFTREASGLRCNLKYRDFALQLHL